MSSRRVVVVDGSNIATEGRSQPSLAQLDEAVRAYREENPEDEIIVVVDATFAHRIDESERELFEEAAAHNELVYPPAGAIGRGDAFLLRIAAKTDAIVLSNDSFQEFHGEHDWLFEKGRLIGGTPVPGVGWIFVARTPVRGPKSREAVKEAKRTKARVGSKDASLPMPVPKAPPPRGKKAKKDDLAGMVEEVAAEEASPDDAEGGKGRGKRRRKRGGRGAGTAPGGAAPPTSASGSGSATSPDLPTLNEPLTFIQFIAEHKLGSGVDGVVESFASHGAFVVVGDARCYIPLSAMGEPPPRSAREVLRKGETRGFVVQALDAARRGIELALPGFEHVAGAPTEETVEAEIAEAPPPRRGRTVVVEETVAVAVPMSPRPAAVRKTAPAKKKPIASKKATKKAAAAPKKKAAAAPAKKTAAVKKKAAPPARKTPPPVKPVKPVKKTAAPKKVAAPPAKKATPAKKAAAKKATAKKAAPPAKKAAAKKTATPKKAAAKKTATTKRTSAKKR